MNNRDENPGGNGVAILYHLQHDVARLDRELQRVDREHDDTRLTLARLGAKVATYAALGALIGGGAVSFLIKFLVP